MVLKMIMIYFCIEGRGTNQQRRLLLKSTLNLQVKLKRERVIKYMINPIYKIDTKFENQSFPNIISFDGEVWVYVNFNNIILQI